MASVVSSFFMNTLKSSSQRGNDGKSWNSLNSAWYQKWEFWCNPIGRTATYLVHCSCVNGGFGHLRVSPSLPVAWAPVGGRVPDDIFVHHVTVTFFLYAACQDLQNPPEPAVHGLEVALEEDRGQSVPDQGLLHQGAQLVLLFGQQLETQVRRFPHPGEGELKRLF